MRILVVNQYFHPDQASTAQLLTELCEDLAEHHQVTVVCGRPSYSPTQVRAGRGLVRTERYGAVKVLRTWSTSYSRHSMPGRIANYATYLASSLAGVIKAERPDVVLTMTDPPFVALAAMLASTVRHVPFVYVCQDVFPDVALALGVISEGPLARSLRSMNRLLRSRAAAVVAIGRDMQQLLVELGTNPTKIHVISNWADTEAIHPLGAPSILRQSQGWADRFVVMHSGNVGLSQELDSLINAAALLRDDADVVIVIVGEGGSKERLERLAARLSTPNVEFLPYQPKASLPDSLGAADLHIVSLHAGLSGAIVPSKVYGIMAAGKPFLAALDKNSEPARLADEFGCGLRIDPGDPRALAAAIRQARSLNLAKMGERGREAAQKHFDRSVATSAYRELLERVAGEPRWA